ncbi:MAG: LolA family protein [Endomicrobiales bacterium]
MKKWHGYIGIAAALLLGGTVPVTAGVTMETLLGDLQKSEDKIQGLRFQFQQDIIYNLTGEKQTNTGEVTFKKPSNLHVKQNNPLEQVIVSNGSKVWIYTPAYQQVIVDSWKKWSENSMVPASIISMRGNWADLNKRFSFSYQGMDEDAYVVMMSPRGREKWKVKLWIEKLHYIPVKSSFLGDSVTVNTTMTKYDINPDVDKQLFNFKPPKGVDVLHLP